MYRFSFLMTFCLDQSGDVILYLTSFHFFFLKMTVQQCKDNAVPITFLYEFLQLLMSGNPTLRRPRVWRMNPRQPKARQPYSGGVGFFCPKTLEIIW